MTAVTICSDFGAQENKFCHCFHCLPSICCEVMGQDNIIFVFWMFNFKEAFSLSSFTFINRLFSTSLLSAIKVRMDKSLKILYYFPIYKIRTIINLILWNYHSNYHGSHESAPSSNYHGKENEKINESTLKSHTINSTCGIAINRTLKYWVICHI